MNDKYITKLGELLRDITDLAHQPPASIEEMDELLHGEFARHAQLRQKIKNERVSMSEAKEFKRLNKKLFEMEVFIL